VPVDSVANSAASPASPNRVLVTICFLVQRFISPPFDCRVPSNAASLPAGIAPFCAALHAFLAN